MSLKLERSIPMRTALFVPGDRPDRVNKAVATAADAVIIDLEDAVSLVKKRETRDLVRDKLSELRGRERNLIVRVNSLESGLLGGDLDAVVADNLTSILVPKMECAEQVREVSSHLLEAEKEHGIDEGSIALMLLIESATGVQNVFDILSTKTNPRRFTTVAFGAADFSLDLGIEITREGHELDYPRSRIPVACRAAGIPPPIDTPFMIDLKDLDALRADAIRAKHLGFQGKLCVHPNQIETCNDVFSPSQEQILEAENVVRAFEEAEAKGVAAIQFEGKLIDAPVVEHARRILRLATSIRRSSSAY